MRKEKMLDIIHPDGRMSSYPPIEKWDEWTEYESRAWPKRVEKKYTLVPTICFNCESACGLLAYVDTENFEIRKFEGNPAHPGSRGRNCAKGPATHNQIYDPERILYPLKRVGKRGEGKWKRVSWEEVLTEIGEKMRESRKVRRDGIMYHVGRPGEDHYTNRCIQAWGVDGHNSHTNICSAAARFGYVTWSGIDRPSPDHANAKVILLISAHLESGHYFNPHAQRIMEAQKNGARIITFDPRLSNTASKSNLWLPTWPGSEPTVLLSVANYLIQNGLYDKEFVKDWVNWQEFMDYFVSDDETLTTNEELVDLKKSISAQKNYNTFENYDLCLKALYREYSFERASIESEVDIKVIQEMAELIANCDGRLAAHTWRSASMGNKGGWQVARSLFFLNVLTGSVGKKGGTSGNSWNKFVPKPFKTAPAGNVWSELLMPEEWPMSFFEMSFLLPHFLEEGRGDIDVYFTRVYNPLWINPDGFMWMKALKDESKIKTHIALTPTWNESAMFADYVLPMGHSGERHDLMSQETHAGQWIGFRQPVQRVAQERRGKKVKFTYETNIGEVWEESEFWVELSGKFDPDGSLGIRQYFESPKRPGELITQDEYWGYIFENSVPGLPERAKEEGLTPLEFMKKFGAYEIVETNYKPFAKVIDESVAKTAKEDKYGRMVDADGNYVGVKTTDGVLRAGVGTPSGRFEFFSSTIKNWGWPEKERILPWSLKSHVHQDYVTKDEDGMLLLPTFRLPTLIHTRSANCKWLYEISHRNPAWMNPIDAKRLGIKSGDLVRIKTEIGYFVDKVWVTEGIKPKIVACSHHLGRWRVDEQDGSVSPGMSSLVDISETGDERKLSIKKPGGAWKTKDPDTSRVWWTDVGVHQNLTHGVHPDPMSGAQCWHQRAWVSVAEPSDKYGDVWVDTNRSMEVYREWHELTRGAVENSPDGTRRPMWFKRPLKPTKEAYALPEKPFRAET
jgi:anaerobic selenocysteine-containing dehydrogenase